MRIRDGATALPARLTVAIRRQIRQGSHNDLNRCRPYVAQEEGEKAAKLRNPSLANDVRIKEAMDPRNTSQAS